MVAVWDESGEVASSAVIAGKVPALLTSILVKVTSRFSLVNAFKLMCLFEYFYVVFLRPLSTVQLYMCRIYSR